jgi:hypothetical protein
MRFDLSKPAMSEDPRSTRPGPAIPLAAFNWKAIAFGLFTDICSTGAMSLVLYALVGARLVEEAATPEVIEQTLLASHLYVLASMAAGLGCTVLGGYVAARIAGRLEYYHALFTGVGVLLFGELMMLGSKTDYSIGLRILGDLLLVPAALYGARLRKRTLRDVK